ncbi:DUF924 family protein [Oceaniglobus roseus]|uniref:DUF924 family protein n=1 Tax=Oceaniglobus roseus TaxID=1737570 RepID=UPI000C7EC73A|nr:DUF924 family protein [Kandeliimicrobium roseum]
MSNPDEVLAFWLDEVGEKGWYEADPALDREVSERFGATWQSAQEGGFALWLTHPSGTLAYIILNDQFPRNMFRGQARAFASDPIALAAAKMAIARGWDMKIDPPARQFFYMPLMHSESLSDQDRCVRMFLTRMGESGQGNLLHSRAHREVIRRFGRFPFRNEALSRSNQSGEADFLANGGYGATVRALEGAGAKG